MSCSIAAETLPLHLVSAHHVDRLRRQPDVPGDRNLGVDNVTDQVGALFAAFDLHDLGAAFLSQSARH